MRERVHVRAFSDLGVLRRALREAERRAAEEAARQAAEAARLERERAWFAHEVGPVTPLPRSQRVVHVRPGPVPEPRQRQLDEAEALRESMSDEFDPLTLLETDGELSYRQPGVGVDVLHKLRRGVWVVQGQVDLHGHTRDEAREALGAFLRAASQRGWRCVRVVHGKGLGSPGREPVLKGKVRTWLAQRQEVLAFTLARGADGGAGAVIVLLDSTPRGGHARVAEQT